MAENKPGNGMQNPFGNGKGGASTSASTPADMITNPHGTGTSVARPRDPFTIHQQQQVAGRSMVNPDSVPEGGLLPFNTPTEKPGHPLGVGTPGKPPPFRITG